MPEPRSDNPVLRSQIRLVRFTWIKENQVDSISFSRGFNLLGERTQTERTILLRLVRYAMGGGHSRIDDDIMHTTREVSLEFLANGNRIVTHRGFEHVTGKFSVTREGHPTLSTSPNEMGEYLLDSLGMPKVYYQRGESRALLSFNDLARAFVVDRDFSYSEILAGMYPEPRREVVKLTLGLTTQEIADVEEEIRSVEARIQRLNEEIRGIERILSHFEVGSLIEIETRRNNLKGLLVEIQADEDALRKRIEEAAANPIEDASYRAEEYKPLREELIAKRERQGDIESELATLTKQTQEKNDLKALLEGEAQKLERHASSQYVLSSFTFSRCPRCLRPIDPDMRAREHESRCMLCARPLQPELEFDTSAWEKALADAKKAVQETEELLSHYSQRRRLLEREGDAVKSRLQWLEAELARQTVRYVSPLVEDLSLISERRSEVLKALSELELEEKQRLYDIKLRDEVLPELKRNRDALGGRLEELQSNRSRRGERVEAFLTHFRSFMRESASSQFRSASWDADELLPRINDQAYTRPMTGFDLAICVLAFHYGLLAMKVKPPEFDTAHPGLLIVDEPQQQRMEPRQYQRIMQLLVELASEYERDVQVLVAATDISGFETYLRRIDRKSDE